MLQIDNLTQTFQGPAGPVLALDDVSLSVAQEEFVVVHGPSGAGKTTLLLLAGGLLQPTSGCVVVDGQAVYALSPEQRCRFRAERIGFVFQRFHLLPYLSVLDNVLTPALAARLEDASARARQLIERFALTDRLRHEPAALSTGERQRVALARALLCGPKLVLADEPTGNLDQENAGVVLECLSQFAADGGAVLLVSHDARLAAIAQRAFRLENGKITPA